MPPMGNAIDRAAALPGHFDGVPRYARPMASEEFQTPVIRALRDHALSFPGVDEGDSCVKRAFRVEKKGFLYLGEKESQYNMMVKLGDSFDAAAAMAKKHERWDAGKFGWVTLRFAPDETAPHDLIEECIEESYRNQAPPALLRELDAT